MQMIGRDSGPAFFFFFPFFPGATSVKKDTLLTINAVSTAKVPRTDTLVSGQLYLHVRPP